MFEVFGMSLVDGRFFDRFAAVLSKFRSGLAIDFSECRDFSLLIYFFCYLSHESRRGSGSDDGFLAIVESNTVSLKAGLLEYSSTLDEKLGGDYFFSDVILSFFKGSFDRYADNLVRNFCFDVFSLLSDEEVFRSAGECFEFLVKYFSDGGGKKSGDDYTPRSLVDLMVSAVNPCKGESVYDPVCGSGGFLVAAGKRDLNAAGEISLSGREVNISSARIAKINCYLHGFHDASIKVESSLRFVDRRKYDVVLANPPFSIPFSDLEGVDYSFFGFGQPPKSNADYAFLQIVIGSMKESGRAAVVVPQGVLFRGGDEGEIRKSIILSGLIDAVVTLPSNIFINTAIPVSILMLKGSAVETGGVFFVDGAAIYESLQKKPGGDQVFGESVLDIFEKRREVEGVSRLVGWNLIAENNYNLSLARYVSPISAEKKSLSELLDRQREMQSQLDSLLHKFYKILDE
ncbi:SAM-dependent methyltransferase [Ectopseudomonas composti]